MKLFKDFVRWESLAWLLVMVLGFSAQAKNSSKKSACPQVQENMQAQYAKEFGLSKAESSEVFLTYRNFQDATFVKAVHSKFCSPRGCATSLFYIPPEACPKVVLNFTGKIKYTGPKKTPYESIRVLERATTVDEGPLVNRRYKFDRAQLNYVENKI